MPRVHLCHVCAWTGTRSDFIHGEGSTGRSRFPLLPYYNTLPTGNHTSIASILHMPQAAVHPQHAYTTCTPNTLLTAPSRDSLRGNSAHPTQGKTLDNVRQPRGSPATAWQQASRSLTSTTLRHLPTSLASWVVHTTLPHQPPAITTTIITPACPLKHGR